jgi:hypothetical protein
MLAFRFELVPRASRNSPQASFRLVKLQRRVAALRDEITRLKSGPGPTIKPSGMERGTEPKPPGSSSAEKANFRCECWQTPDGEMMTVPLAAIAPLRADRWRREM